MSVGNSLNDTVSVNDLIGFKKPLNESQESELVGFRETEKGHNIELKLPGLNKLTSIILKFRGVLQNQTFSDFIAYYKTFREPMKIFFSVILHHYPLQAKLKNNGSAVKITCRNDLRLVMSKLPYSYSEEGVLSMQTHDGRCVKMRGAKKNGDVASIFGHDEYNFLDCTGNNVLDIGANIGDSPIYFASKGAKRVVALEPFPNNFKLALENLKLNEMQDVITMVNAGASANSESIYVEADIDANYASSLNTAKKGEVPVPTFTLKELVKKYGMSGGQLKMDCEGCEFETLLNTDESTLKSFNKIQLEYHFEPSAIVKKLEDCGFFVKVDQGRLGYNWHQKRYLFLGMIYAEKVLEQVAKEPQLAIA